MGRGCTGITLVKFFLKIFWEQCHTFGYLDRLDF